MSALAVEQRHYTIRTHTHKLTCYTHKVTQSFFQRIVFMQVLPYDKCTSGMLGWLGVKASCAHMRAIKLARGIKKKDLFFFSIILFTHRQAYAC